MDRDLAIRIDGLTMSIRGSLDGLARYMKDNLSEEKYASLIQFVGQSMAETVYLSRALYSDFPDIVPKELRPPEAAED